MNYRIKTDAENLLVGDDKKMLTEHFDAPNNTEMVLAASVQFIKTHM